jgi:hypothetical protein
MRTEESWKEQQENLKAARVLAAFLNVEFQPLVKIENVVTIGEFQREHPDFFPQGWSEYEPTYGGGSFRKQWQITQQFLREAWQSEFKIELYDYLKILQSIFNPDHLPAVNPQWNGPHYRRWMGPPYRPAFADMWDILWERDHTKPPYYLAIKFLSGHGWQAATCKYCGRKFIRESSQGKFCTYGDTIATDGTVTTCSWAYRKPSKAKNWEKHKDELNASRREQYALQNKKERGRKSPRKTKRR